MREFCVASSLCSVVHGVRSSLAIMLLRTRAGCYTLCCGCLCLVSLFLMVLWVGLRSVIVAFPGPTHMLSHNVEHQITFENLKKQ